MKMKKVLTLLLAGALTFSMGTSVFASPWGQAVYLLPQKMR